VAAPLLALPRVRETWLFLRDGVSIWLQRSTEDGLRVVLHGPLAHRREFVFHGELELLDFLSDVERRLVSKGWRLQPLVKDRRAKTGDSAGPSAR
jgi:hypothetical protein